MGETESQPAAGFQYSLRTLLIAVTLILICVAYAAQYGFGIAIWFGVLASLECWWIVRAVRLWRTLCPTQRFYAVVEGVIFSFLLIAFIVVTATSPFSIRERNARHLQTVLRREGRFSHVQVRYDAKPKWNFLSVEGAVDSDRDFRDLRTTVLSYDWCNDAGFGIYWDVTVVSPFREYHGSDDELFGEGN